MGHQWCYLQSLWNEIHAKLTTSHRLHYWQHLIWFHLRTWCVTTPCEHSTFRRDVIIWNYGLGVLTNRYQLIRNLLFINIAYMSCMFTASVTVSIHLYPIFSVISVICMHLHCSWPNITAILTMSYRLCVTIITDSSKLCWKSWYNIHHPNVYKMKDIRMAFNLALKEIITQTMKIQMYLIGCLL